MENVVDEKILKEVDEIAQGMLSGGENNVSRKTENQVEMFIDLLSYLEPLELVIEKMQGTPFAKGNYKTLLRELRHKTNQIVMDQYKWMNSFKESNIAEQIFAGAKANGYLAYLINQLDFNQRAKLMNIVEVDFLGKVQKEEEIIVPMTEDKEVELKLEKQEPVLNTDIEETGGELVEEPELTATGENPLDALLKSSVTENAVDDLILDPVVNVQFTEEEIKAFADKWDPNAEGSNSFAGYIAQESVKVLAGRVGDRNAELFYALQDINEDERTNIWTASFILKQ